MFQDYYDCPKDLRKDYWKIVVEAIIRITCGIGVIVGLLIMLIVLS